MDMFEEATSSLGIPAAFANEDMTSYDITREQFPYKKPLLFVMSRNTDEGSLQLYVLTRNAIPDNVPLAFMQAFVTPTPLAHEPANTFKLSIEPGSAKVVAYTGVPLSEPHEPLETVLAALIAAAEEWDDRIERIVDTNRPPLPREKAGAQTGQDKGAPLRQFIFHRN
jgi:hypothetical protein